MIEFEEIPSPCPEIVIIMIPMKANPSANKNDFCCFSHNKYGDKMATQSGVVVTRITELVTVIDSNEVIQKMKCNPSKTPESRISALYPAARDSNSLIAFLPKNGINTIVLINMRDQAMVMELTSRCANRIKREAVETAQIAINRINPAELFSNR